MRSTHCVARSSPFIIPYDKGSNSVRIQGSARSEGPAVATMTRGTMLLLLLCCLGASAVAGMSPACSAAYGGDEERYTTDVAVFQRGCAAEKRVKDPCPMACYEIVRKVQYKLAQQWGWRCRGPHSHL